jgi:ketosteroid isomerase-like protein
MSRENVELAKRAMDMYNTDAALSEYDALVTPDFGWITAMARVEDEVMRGREGVAEYYASLDAAWESVRVFGGEFRDLGDRVLWLGQMEGRGRGSGAVVRSPAASLYEFRDGRISRLRSFLDHDEALRAVGLAEQAMSEESTTPDLVERQKRATEAANRRDLDAVMAFIAPDAVYDMSPVGMGVFEGQAAARGFIEDWWASYEEHEFEAEKTLDLGNGVGFRVLIQKGRPVGSSGEVELRYAVVSVWKDGLIVRVTNYTDIDEARDAAERLAEERG